LEESCGEEVLALSLGLAASEPAFSVFKVFKFLIDSRMSVMCGYKVPRRILDVSAEAAFKVLRFAKNVERSGRRVIHLEIGEPDFDTPKHIKDAAVEALKKNLTHYTPTLGIPELRQEIAESVKRDYGVEVDWERNVAVTTGCKQAILASTLAIVDEGEEVIYPNPGYPEYEAAAYFAGGRPVPYRLRLEEGFRMTAERLAELITPKTKLVVLNTPNNPCGVVMPEEDVRGIVELAEDHGFYILSDEVYRPILFDDLKHYSPLHVKKSLDRLIIADGFSKRYAMTGWRLGYALVPEEILPQVFKLLNVMNSCPNSISQYAALAALRGPQEPVMDMVREYWRRRDAVVEELSKLEDIRFVKPEGAFYALVDVSKILNRLEVNSEEFVKMLIERYGAAFLHGTALGSYGEGFIRISFAASEEDIREGIRLLGKAIEELTRS